MIQGNGHIGGVSMVEQRGESAAVVVECLAPRDSCYNGGMRTALIGIVARVVL